MNTENNKLIAEFMGLQKYSSTEYVWHTIIFSEDTLKYDFSWDWLMPVVEKIESIIGEGSHVIIGKKIAFISWSDGNMPVKAEGKGETKIEAVYKAVVEFIAWYNKQPKK